MSPRQILSPSALLGWLRRRRPHWGPPGRAVQLLGGAFFWVAGRRGRPEPTLASARSILVVRLDEIGDVVMTSPFLRELRRNAPRAWITLVVKPEIVNLVERCPHVNEVLAYDWRAQGASAQWTLHARALGLAWKRLWRRRFDLALLPRSGADYYHAAFAAFFSGAARRVGYSRTGRDSAPPPPADYDSLLTDVLDCPRNLHEVERNLHMIRALGGTVSSAALELWLDSDDEAKAESLLHPQGEGPDRGVIAFGPGGGQARKCWPVERFIEIGRRLAVEMSARIVIVGGSQDRAMGDEIAHGIGPAATNLASRSTLRQTAAVLKRCALYVGNDSGPMHLAAAVGTAVVAISCHPRDGTPFFLNAPERFGPWGVESVTLQPAQRAGECRATCVAGHPHCILGVTTATVQQAAESMLAGKRMRT